MDRDKMINLYKGPSIDASYQVSVHLAEGFQRRRLKCEKLTDDGRRTPSDGKSSLCLWQGELKMGTVVPLEFEKHPIHISAQLKSYIRSTKTMPIHFGDSFIY
jgi:hypothetical protein